MKQITTHIAIIGKQIPYEKPSENDIEYIKNYKSQFMKIPYKLILTLTAMTVICLWLVIVFNILPMDYQFEGVITGITLLALLGGIRIIGFTSTTFFDDIMLAIIYVGAIGFNVIMLSMVSGIAKDSLYEDLIFIKIISGGEFVFALISLLYAYLPAMKPRGVKRIIISDCKIDTVINKNKIEFAYGSIYIPTSKQSFINVQLDNYYYINGVRYRVKEGDTDLHYLVVKPPLGPYYMIYDARA